MNRINQKLLNSIRGMHDILPADLPAWQMLERTVKDVFRRYGFSEIRTPVVEKTELFARAMGEATDVVEKEMYSFEDRNGDFLSLRPEGTAGVVRAVTQRLQHCRKQGSPLGAIPPLNAGKTIPADLLCVTACQDACA